MKWGQAFLPARSRRQECLRHKSVFIRGCTWYHEYFMALTATNLGFPRIGPNRELKKALEGYWAGKADQQALVACGRELRARNWRLQQEAGIAHIPSNDFSFYDHVLDTCALVGAVPERYGRRCERLDLDTYFAMARGTPQVPAMEMTKWFDTNYHYIVPEFAPDQSFRLASEKPVEEFREALELGIRTRPVLVGPVTFLLLGKTHSAHFDRLSLLDRLLPVYEEVLAKLAAAGTEWVQMDEPCLALDRAPEERKAFEQAYGRLAQAAGKTKLLVATYFEGLRENMATAARLPVAALHLDLVRAPGQLDAALEAIPASMMLSLGVVNGRNIWRTDLAAALELLKRAQARLGAGRVLVAPSCSLLHVPIDLDLEKKLDPALRDWLGFARQKLAEVVTLARALEEGEAAVRVELEAGARAVAGRRSSPRIHDPKVKARVAAIRPEDTRRQSRFAARQARQREQLKLPLFPTTTIGSFPQTAEIRAARQALRKGEITEPEYVARMKTEIEKVIRKQEDIGLDVLVHGEPERKDMVEFFGEQMPGFAFTEHAWVQSYGSRYVKPPILYGDVSRPRAMTVAWAEYAQSLTDKPVKGMLTGPMTILQWSFVRDDQPRSETARQLALALRDEVRDLEQAGIRIIQIDEPALREGLPLRRADWAAYLAWAVESFRLASSGVRDDTQIQTHMCYAEFQDIMESIAEMDADVILIECSRSQMELLDVFARFRYPNEIGPGIYDIHSPRVPPRQEMERLLDKACAVLAPQQLWVNPDCGLKTRRWEEVTPSLENLVAAARALRAKFSEATVGR